LTGSSIAEGRFVLEDDAKAKLFLQVGGLGLYFPGEPTSDSGEIGTLRLCTRVEYTRNYKGAGDDPSVILDNAQDNVKESISILDTNYIIDVDLTADFSTFKDTAVSIFKRSNTKLNTEASVEIDVNAYICDIKNKPVKPKTVENPNIVFTAGQNFRICVRPKWREPDYYSVVGFKSITCSNSGETRQIVVDTVPDALTEIDTEGRRRKKQDGSLGFTSVVTSGFFASDENDFKCTGEVILAADDFGEPTEAPTERPRQDKGAEPTEAPRGRPKARGLIVNSTFSTKTSSSSISSSINNGYIKRKMQEAEQDAPFAVAIELADSTSDGSSSPSYGPLLGLYYMTIFGAFVVAAALL
jgi:hypothetical protein